MSLFADEDSSLSARHLRRWRTSRRTPLCAGGAQTRLQEISWLRHSSASLIKLLLWCFRCRTLSGSPRPKSFKKIHFIKNLRQHDMRNGRYKGRRWQLVHEVQCPFPNGMMKVDVVPAEKSDFCTRWESLQHILQKLVWSSEILYCKRFSPSCFQ